MKNKFTRDVIIAMAVLTAFSGLAAAEEDPAVTPACPAPAAAQAVVGDALPPVELGKVAWGRDFGQAVAESQKTGKPLMVLFDEVPGCGGCKTYGKVLLSHPLLVEAAETLFVPVFIRNNDPDKNSADNQLLKRFDEKSWNFPVVRFMNAESEDLTPACRTPTVNKGAWPALLNNLTKALQVSGRPIPKYLETFGAEYGATKTATAVFAMGCYWAGEAKLGALPGVVRTRVGYHKGTGTMHEIVEVFYDAERTDFRTVASKAKEQRCAQWVIMEKDDSELATAREVFGGEGVLISPEAPEFRDNDSNYQYGIYRRPGHFFNSITSLQATRMHGDEVANRAAWLSPRQQALGGRIDALFKGLGREQNEALFQQMRQDLNPSQYRNLYKMTLAEYHAQLIGCLEQLENRDKP